MFKTLYLCYFGLREPLVQTQVIPYLREISKGGTEVSLLTFEPNPRQNWTKEQIETEREKLATEGIKWHFSTYHKRPSVPATAFDILCGTWRTWRLTRQEKFDVLHVRIHIPAVMAVIARKFSRKKPKILFDIRGFIPEEYTDAGIWKENGWLYKTVKRTEKWLLKESDGFVVLTEKAREILFPESRETGEDKFGRPVEVIPCCVDLQRFDAANETSRRELRQKYNLGNRFVITYVGSFGGWYLTDEMLDFFQAAHERNPQVFTLILTQRDKEKVVENLRKKGFSDGDFLVESVPPSEIPKFLSASDIALSFIKECYSKQSSSPTKIAEYLASGLSVITNRGVGDVAEQIEEDKTGAIVDDFSHSSYLNALLEIENLRKNTDLAENCRQSARARFDLQKVGGAKYRLLYEKMLGKQ